jgi:hypothetical protein
MRVIDIKVFVREDDEQDLVDGLIEFVEQDPWSLGTQLDRRDATKEEFEELGIED